uniref:Neprosin PEP catalytic domain-containing protein n=1 Tax=Zea mays TaxID=4577 RepID=B4FHN7_MAIZE|nr:unknown [Zea mays]|eukprot:NP_001132687.1 uncharacterized LOC100194165 precursor [Zea mays]
MASCLCFRRRRRPIIASSVPFFLLLVSFLASASASSTTTTKLLGSGNNATRRVTFSSEELRGLRSITARLARLRDASVKTIQSPDGDVIDCVPAHLQPAFEHPKLRSQKPEEEPEERPRSSAGRFSDADLDEDDDPLPQVWRRSGEHCPEGTVPVRRTTEDDVLRATASSATRFGMKARGAGLGFARRDSTGGGHEHAVGYVTGGQFYGAKASLNVWPAQVASPAEFSLSQIWVISGAFGNDLNTIEAGWQVSPQLYGDNSPRTTRTRRRAATTSTARASCRPAAAWPSAPPSRPSPPTPAASSTSRFSSGRTRAGATGGCSSAPARSSATGPPRSSRTSARAPTWCSSGARSSTRAPPARRTRPRRWAPAASPPRDTRAPHTSETCSSSTGTTTSYRPPGSACSPTGRGAMTSPAAAAARGAPTSITVGPAGMHGARNFTSILARNGIECMGWVLYLYVCFVRAHSSTH